MKILLLGSSSFLGKNIKKYFAPQYELEAPTHTELDLLDFAKVKDYLKKHSFDIVINAAMYNEKFDDHEMLHASLRMFHHLKICQDLYGKMIYFGSGAEFNKEFDIVNAREEDFGTSLPFNYYGLAKYLMQDSLKESDKIVNLRLFAVYGYHEDYASKFISNIMLKMIAHKPIIMHQNVHFDYLYIDDFLKILAYFLQHDAEEKDYNICSGTGVYLESIAKMIFELDSKNHHQLIIEKKGLGKEYTGSNKRLLSLHPFTFTPLREGIQKLYQAYQENLHHIDWSRV